MSDQQADKALVNKASLVLCQANNRTYTLQIIQQALIKNRQMQGGGKDVWERGGGEEAGEKKLTVSKGEDGSFICEWTQLCGTWRPDSEETL